MWKRFPFWKERRGTGQQTPPCGLVLCRIAGVAFVAEELSGVPGQGWRRQCPSSSLGYRTYFNFYFGGGSEDGLLPSILFHLRSLSLTKRCSQAQTPVTANFVLIGSGQRPVSLFLPPVWAVSAAHLCHLAPTSCRSRKACLLLEVSARV